MGLGAEYWNEHVRELDKHTIITPSKARSASVPALRPSRSTGSSSSSTTSATATPVMTKAALLDDTDRPRQGDARRPDHAPELDWEKRGDVDEVVFVQGAVLRPDGTIYLSYGAADRCIGAEVEPPSSSARCARPPETRRACCRR